MSISSRLDQLHLQARGNRWLWLFAIFCRVALAAGFIPSGMVKVLGERFTSLAVNHPMGHYLEAIYHTGFYYTAIGVLQVTAAILLLIPRTAALGAVIYFPIILNICILSLAVRFDGSLVTSPLMVLANVYLLCWYYHTWKFILPFNRQPLHEATRRWKDLSSEFPDRFFIGTVVTVFMVIMVVANGFDMMPRNTLAECNTQCEESENPQACYTFCDCIHQQGLPLETCLEAYTKAVEDTAL
ncbi:DoxX family protein [Pontibacter litorisediminis]|uniref:DoxX family protein n=1 Tax=Pontibacter litorisediminis TaxID=1846260 RepID=UPI0023EB4134|nr:DoxX family protein [Pontibacter litorisediminis]